MLRRFSNDAHAHLISLLATYEQSRRYYLIFHWADANLRGYWRKINPRPSFDPQTVLWVASQCLGIADGLSAIHRYEEETARGSKPSESFGYHGDIKPENVLWFASHDEGTMGKLQLADFGLPSDVLDDLKTPTSKLARLRAYQPPESDLEGWNVGRSYDIWTLGCLYLEFITWLLGGWDLLDAFEFTRLSTGSHSFDMASVTFFRIVERRPGEKKTLKAVVKPEVTEVCLVFPLEA
jgi:serine/threonine protein kinase